MFILSLFGLVAAVTIPENMSVLKVILLIIAAACGCLILSKRQLFLVSSCMNLFLFQRSEEGLIRALCAFPELIFWC